MGPDWNFQMLTPIVDLETKDYLNQALTAMADAYLQVRIADKRIPQNRGTEQRIVHLYTSIQALLHDMR